MPLRITEPEWIFPFDSMEVGDSFFIPTLCPTEIIYAVDCGAKRAKIKVKAYMVTHNNLIGVRAWRLS